MTIKNEGSFIKIGHLSAKLHYRISINCDGTYRFNFVLKGKTRNIMVDGRVDSNGHENVFTYTPPIEGDLILINAHKHSWAEANIIVEEI